MVRRKRKKKKLVGSRRVFIKIMSCGNGNYAQIYVAMNSLDNVFGGVVTFPYHSGAMDKWDLLAVGQVYWNSKYKTYYGTASRVQTSYRGQGHGDYLYKAMLMAAVKLAKKDKKKKVYFSPHGAVGDSTSTSAWRCYKSLARKGYLKPISSKSIVPSTIYEVAKIPKCIKPIMLRALA